MFRKRNNDLKQISLIKLALCLITLGVFSTDVVIAMEKKPAKSKTIQKDSRSRKSRSSSSSSSSSNSSSSTENQYFVNEQATRQILAEAFENNQYDCLLNFLAYYSTDSIVSEFAHEAIRRENSSLLAQFLHIAPALLEAPDATGLTPLQLILSIQHAETILPSFLRVIVFTALENHISVLEQLNPQLNSEFTIRFIRFADDETLKQFLHSLNDEELKMTTSLLDSQLFNRIFDMNPRRVSRLLIERCNNFLTQFIAHAASAEPNQVNLMTAYQQLGLSQVPQASQSFFS